MKHRLSISIFTLLSLTWIACNDVPDRQNQEYIERSNEEVKEVIALNRKSESQPVRGIGKGVIEPNYSVSVYGKLPHYIEESNAKEGLTVNKGDLLFQLESQEIRNTISKLDVLLAERELALRDILIGQGYSWEDTLHIPHKKMEYAKIKSGYNSAMKEKELALQNLEKTKVYAPCSGFIEELKVYKYDMMNPGSPSCKIVNTDRLKVTFYVLETELKNMKVGRTVYITPVVDDLQRYEAQISRVIPRVTSDGMIKVKAILTEKVDLLPGMNVFVDL